jgi:hypothetical protein
MPNRLLRPEILTSHKVNRLTESAELFYRRLMSVVDDFGRYYADCLILRAACYPLRTHEITCEQMQTYVGACEQAGLISVYEVENKLYLELLNLGSPRAKSSKFPARENICSHVQTYVTYSGSGSGSGSGASVCKSPEQEPEPDSPLASQIEPEVNPIPEAAPAPDTPRIAGGGDLGELQKGMQRFAQHLTRSTWKPPDWGIVKRAGKATRMATVGQACEFLERTAWIKRPQGANAVEMRSYAFVVKLLEDEFGGGK